MARRLSLRMVERRSSTDSSCQLNFFCRIYLKRMGKFMQWTSAIILYFGLSLATFNRSLDPKDGTYEGDGCVRNSAQRRRGLSSNAVRNGLGRNQKGQGEG